MAERKSSKRSVAVAKAKERAAKLREDTKGHGAGFLDFIREQGVIGLAVGLAIGTAAGDTVSKLVRGFIDPVVQFVVGSQESLNSSVWRLELFGRTADFAWGAFVSSAITLVATALVIYWIVNVLRLNRLDKKKS